MIIGRWIIVSDEENNFIRCDFCKVFFNKVNDEGYLENVISHSIKNHDIITMTLLSGDDCVHIVAGHSERYICDSVCREGEYHYGPWASQTWRIKDLMNGKITNGMESLEK